MTIVPRYNFVTGTEITLMNRPMAVTGMTDNGYLMVGVEDGVTSVITFDRLLDQLKLPGAKINAAPATTGDRLKQRLGGYTSVKALQNTKQKAKARFHVAICKAVDIYVAARTEEDSEFNPSIRALGAKEAREFIAKQSSLFLGLPVRLQPLRGGEETAGYILYKGRTITELYRRYKALEAGESAEDALVPVWHLRGNRTRRLCRRTRELMTESWEKIGLDKKGPALRTCMHIWKR